MEPIRKKGIGMNSDITVYTRLINYLPTANTTWI